MTQDTLTAVLDAADRGDWQEAWTLTEGAASQTGTDYEWLLTSAMVLNRLERQHEARSHLLRAASLAPERPEAYHHLAQQLAAAGQWERAITYLGQAHSVAPGDPAASAIIHRMGQRGVAEQMPPLATEFIDTAGIEQETAWIQSLAQ